MASVLEEELSVLAAEENYATSTKTTSTSTSPPTSSSTSESTTLSVTQIAPLLTFNYTQSRSSLAWTESRANFVVAMVVVVCFLLMAGALLLGLMFRYPSYHAHRRRRRRSRLPRCCRGQSSERDDDHSAAESRDSGVMVIRQVEANNDALGARRPDDAFPWRLPPPNNRLPPLVRPAKALPKPRVGFWHDVDTGAENVDLQDSGASARTTHSYVIRVNSAS